MTAMLGPAAIVAERLTIKKSRSGIPKGKTIAAMLRMTSARDWRRRLGR